MSEFVPWQNHAEHQEAVRRRELSLPLKYRMAGNKRLLRDALLATMLLAPAFAPRTLDLVALAARENKRIEMVGRVRGLKARMSYEQIETAHNAAKDLFSLQILSTKQAQLGNTPNPRFKDKRKR